MERYSFSRAELVQFGNALLRKHNVNDQVTHADVENHTGLILETVDYRVLATNPTNSAIQVIKRKPDGIEFSIGDRVSNGGPMCGRIVRITTDQAVNNPDGTDATIWTDYSGVGMNLASISHVPELPSRFQHGDGVMVKLPGFWITHAVVTKVHFANSKVFYDLEIWWKTPGVGDCSTRIHNVSEQILEARS